VGESASEFREAVRELVETTYPEPADHPAEERWIAYRKGELPAAEAALLEEHLVRCRDCFDLVQMADALLAPEEDEAEEESDARAVAAVGRLLRAEPDATREARKPARRASTTGFYVPYALAASFLIAFLGLGAWNLERGKALKMALAPRPDAPIYDFVSGERLSEGVKTEERTVTAVSGPCTLVFHLGNKLPLYRLSFRDASTDRELWAYPLQRKDDIGAYIVTLPGGLAPGRYRLEFFDGAPGASERVLEQQILNVVVARPGG